MLESEPYSNLKVLSGLSSSISDSFNPWYINSYSHALFWKWFGQGLYNVSFPLSASHADQYLISVNIIHSESC